MKETKLAKKTVKAKAKKPRIGLDPKGIDKLEKIMLANGKYFYNQGVFGEIRECETELCGAGFAHLLAVGPKKFHSEVKRYQSNRFSTRFPYRCVHDGGHLLGIKDLKDYSVTIFASSYDWPYDLMDGFDNLDGQPMKQVRFYIRMLRTRANSDGSLTEKGEKRY